MAIKTLSIPADQEEFLANNPDLSPSKMLQSKIIEVRENRRIRFEETNRLRRAIATIQKELQTANDEIDRLKKEKKLISHD